MGCQGTSTISNGIESQECRISANRQARQVIRKPYLANQPTSPTSSYGSSKKQTGWPRIRSAAANRSLSLLLLRSRLQGGLTELYRPHGVGVGAAAGAAAGCLAERFLAERLAFFAPLALADRFFGDFLADFFLVDRFFVDFLADFLAAFLFFAISSGSFRCGAPHHSWLVCPPGHRHSGRDISQNERSVKHGH
jgi:hypothetical protein